MDSSDRPALPLIELVFELVGGQAQLASLLGVSKQNVWFWGQPDRQVPERHCPSIERLTAGRVTCEQLRGDVSWARIPDPDWPWHSRGRPALDLARNAGAALDMPAAESHPPAAS